MAIRMMNLLSGNLATLRYEPTAKRIRVCLGGEPVADTHEARLVWEPRRVVPTYAVPLAALEGQLVPAGAESGADEDVGVRLPAISSRPTAIARSLPRAPPTRSGSAATTTPT